MAGQQISVLIERPVRKFVWNVTGLTGDQFYKLQDVLINPFPFSVMVKPRKICEENVHSVILVHSAFDNFKKRTAIRSTWGSMVNKSSIWPRIGPLNHSVALFFVFGKYKDEGKNDGIYEENLRFGDIVQGNFVDSYKNMTLKSLLDFKFIIEFCSMAKFLIKSDDDMFINLPFLLNEMDEIPKRSIMGALCVGSKARRFGKWLITKEEFPFETYPTYEAGATYVITRDLWEDIFNASHFVPYIFIDDVYITGIIGKILNVTHVSKNKFAYWTTKVNDNCDFVTNKMFTATSLTAQKIEDIWKSLPDLKCNETNV